METTNKAWRLAARPDGEIEPKHFRWSEEPMPEPNEGEALVRTIYLSLDPTNRIWMSDVDQYMPPVEIGDVMRGGTLGIVERSRSSELAPGDLVAGFWGWQTHAAVSARALRARVPRDTGLPLDAWMSVLGGTGLTAYFGLLDIGQPKAGETVVISAAAGAVGSIVGQIARLKGCRAVGIAGSAEKCRWLTEELGFTAAIDYRAGNVLENLRRHCPNGIDVVFENVGGEILDASLTLLNFKARIALCGLISTYNTIEGTRVPGPYMFRNILMKRARIEGFIVTDFAPRFAEGRAALRQWLEQGKLKYKVDIVDGLENAPGAVSRLFTGANTGKLLVRVSPEP